MPFGSLATTSANRTGNSSRVTPVASSTSTAGSVCRHPRTVTHTAASPTSHSMYCGLITRLVVVNSRVAVKAASHSVAGPGARVRTRHRNSQPTAARLSVSATVPATATPGPRNSSEP